RIYHTDSPSIASDSPSSANDQEPSGHLRQGLPYWPMKCSGGSGSLNGSPGPSWLGATAATAATFDLFAREISVAACRFTGATTSGAIFSVVCSFSIVCCTCCACCGFSGEGK